MEDREEKGRMSAEDQHYSGGTIQLPFFINCLWKISVILSVANNFNSKLKLGQVSDKSLQLPARNKLQTNSTK